MLVKSRIFFSSQKMIFIRNFYYIYYSEYNYLYKKAINLQENINKKSKIKFFWNSKKKYYNIVKHREKIPVRIVLL